MPTPPEAFHSSMTTARQRLAEKAPILIDPEPQCIGLKYANLRERCHHFHSLHPDGTRRLMRILKGSDCWSARSESFIISLSLSACLSSCNGPSQNSHDGNTATCKIQISGSAFQKHPDAKGLLFDLGGFRRPPTFLPCSSTLPRAPWRSF